MKRSSSSHGGEEYAGRFVAGNGVELRLFGGLSSFLSCILLLVVLLSKDDSMFEDSACSSWKSMVSSNWSYWSMPSSGVIP